MHEVGHNLGLGHSGDPEDPYGDQSAMMGYSYFEDDGPEMCFNAAKNFQLNWYKNQETTFNPLENLSREPTTFILNGVDDAVRGKSKKLVTLRLETDGRADYYIGYNRATGINSGTVEAKNQVSVFKKERGGPKNYGKSIRVIAMSSNDEFTIEKWNGSVYDVTIRVVGKIGKNIKDAKIEVSVSGFIPTEAPTASCNGVNRFILELGIDAFGLETSWELKENTSGELIASGAKENYLAGEKYEEPMASTGAQYICLKEEACYDFEIFDEYGDGICCANDYKGYFRGILDGRIIFKGGAFGKSEKHTFCTFSASRTPSPTFMRTPAPTSRTTPKPTAAKTKSPTTRKIKCKNSRSKFRVNGKKKTCIWLKQIKKLTKTRCKEKDDKGRNISDLCPKICAKAGIRTCWSTEPKSESKREKAKIEAIHTKRVPEVKRKKKNSEVKRNGRNDKVGEKKKNNGAKM